MARKPRIHFPGALYHVIFRGNAGQPIFSGDEDRYRFYLLLQEGTCRFGYRVHGFCLMTNHIHLVLQAGNLPLSKGMQNLAFRFTRWMNWREGRTGHLFQGRFKAVLVDADAYLLELVRYLHFNPLRAGMVANPVEYRWSSHRAYLGDELLPWLTTDFVLAQFHDDLSPAREAYAAFMAAGAGETYRREFHSGSHESRILGDDRFAEDVLAQTEGAPCKPISGDRLKEAVMDEFCCTMEDLVTRSQRQRLSLARAALGWLAVQTGAVSLTEAGTWVGRDVVTMSAAVRRLADRAERVAELKDVMERLLLKVSRQEA
jgi:REP element-mobilizing transposase RayT